MPNLDRPDTEIFWCEDGDPNGEPIIFAHPLGTNLTVWDNLIETCTPLAKYRLIRFDLRGHGESPAPKPPYSMGTLVSDVEALLDHLNIRNAVFVGAHIGGQIAQGLAVKRLDQIRALVLVNTAAKIGIKSKWDKEIKRLEISSPAAVANDFTNAWFSRSATNSDMTQHWRNVFCDTSIDGLLGCCAAISGTDFYTPVSGLRLSTLGLSAYNDTLIPPDLMRDTVELIHGSDFQILPRAGHLSMVEQPEEFGARLVEFLASIGHDHSSCTSHDHHDGHHGEHHH